MRPLCFALALSITGSAYAQEGRAEIVVADPSAPRSNPVGAYAGIEPGEAQAPPAYRRLARRGQARIVTWPGFVARPDGGSRFFVQLTAPIAPALQSNAGRVEVLLPNTAIHLRNSGRWLETQFFNTPVQRARLERRRGGFALVLYLRTPATPTIHTEPAPGGVFHYVYVDFAAGSYAPVVGERARVEAVEP